MNRSMYALSLPSLALSAVMLGGCIDVRINPPKVAGGAPNERALRASEDKAAPSEANVRSKAPKAVVGVTPSRQALPAEKVKAERRKGARQIPAKGERQEPTGNCQTPDDCNRNGVGTPVR